MREHFDARWIGVHGIGRFAKEVADRLGLPDAALPFSPTSPLDVFGATGWLLAHPAARLFSPGYNAPLVSLNRYSLVVHDLNHIDLPYNSSALKRLYYRIVLRRACRKARRVLTVSEFTASRIAEWAGVDRARVRVVGNGVSRAFVPEGPKHDEGAPFFLVVGNRKKHKNESLAVEAFALLSDRPDARLVFVGPDSQAISNVALALGVAARVRFVQGLPEDTIASYYRGAEALLFPSLYEGFGLPIIEAMACACPVISSDATAMPEICADAALLVDPRSPAAWAGAMTKILNEPALAGDLRSRGLVNAARFSWDEVAARVRAELESEQ